MVSFPSKASFTRRVHAFIGHWWPITVNVLGTALLAIAAASPHATFEIGKHAHAWRPWLIATGIIFFGFGAVNTGKRQLRLDRLQSERAQSEREAEAGARALLRLVFHELDELRAAAGHLSNERVSLFRCDGDHFILLGRRSACPPYDRPGRSTYPEAEGCMGKAWRDGKADANALPPPGPSKPWSAEWIAAQGELGLPEPVAAALTMPSRSYLAFRIEGRERALGVIVFESVNTSNQVEQTHSEAALTLGDLEPLQQAASSKLAHLLRESEFITAATVASLLPSIRD